MVFHLEANDRSGSCCGRLVVGTTIPLGSQVADKATIRITLLECDNKSDGENEPGLMRLRDVCFRINEPRSAMTEALYPSMTGRVVTCIVAAAILDGFKDRV